MPVERSRGDLWDLRKVPFARGMAAFSPVIVSDCTTEARFAHPEPEGMINLQAYVEIPVRPCGI
jgi:hypothetical protein